MILHPDRSISTYHLNKDIHIHRSDLQTSKHEDFPGSLILKMHKPLQMFATDFPPVHRRTIPKNTVKTTTLKRTQTSSNISRQNSSFPAKIELDLFWKKTQRRRSKELLCLQQQMAEAAWWLPLQRTRKLCCDAG